MFNVTVLCPNGRRQQVKKINNNTSLLQIIEEVCAKQGFDSNEYDLKFHNRIVDGSQIYQFANIPNNATLELTKSAQNRAHAKVTIALQSEETNSRVVEDFVPSVTLWDILQKLSNDGENQNFELNASGLCPVIIYMRREIIGIENLKQTTLRQLGLVSGKAILRLVYRPQGLPLEQAHVEVLLPKQPKINPDEEETAQSNSEENTAKDQSLASNLIGKLKQSTSTSNQQDINSSNNDSSSAMEIDVSSSDSNLLARNVSNESRISEVAPSSSIQKKESSNNVYGLDSCDIKFINDDRGTIIFNLNNVKENKELIPDEIYNVTLDDAKFLMRDLTRKRRMMEEAPLITKEMRERDKSLSEKLKKYPNTKLRIHFPDNCVIQSSFESIDSVAVVMKYIRQFLSDPLMEFSLYIRPPKKVLQVECTLFEECLVPAAVVHFESAYPFDHYIAEEYLQRRTNE